LGRTSSPVRCYHAEKSLEGKAGKNVSLTIPFYLMQRLSKNAWSCIYMSRTCLRIHDTTFRHRWQRLLFSFVIKFGLSSSCEISPSNPPRIPNLRFSQRWLWRVLSSGTACSACCLLHAGSLLGLVLDPEDGGDMLLWNVGWFSTDYTVISHKMELFIIQRNWEKAHIYRTMADPDLHPWNSWAN
jgi:hypothetical protein